MSAANSVVHFAKPSHPDLDRHHATFLDASVDFRGRQEGPALLKVMGQLASADPRHSFSGGVSRRFTT